MNRAEALSAAEVCFQRHGLPYFVPSERAAVRAALRPGRTLPRLVAVVLVGAAAGIGLAWFADEMSAGPALLLAIVLGAAVWYALTALRFRPILALVIVQAVQVLLLAASVFLFFLVFGALVMEPAVQQAWVDNKTVQNLPWLPSVSVQLVKVSIFLAGFSGLYLTVSTLTDETYRAQFFGSVLRELERAVGFRAVYLAVRAQK